MANLCALCEEFKKPELDYRRLYKTDNFTVLVPIGPLRIGHLLIVSNEHYLSMGHLPEGMFDELHELHWKTNIILGKHYDNERRILSFEHGPVSETKRGGCCVDHMHLHVVPLDNPELILRDVEKVLGKGENARMVDLRERVEKGIPYVYLNAGGIIREKHCFEYAGEWPFVFDAENLPSQFMLKVVSKFTGKPNTYDWAVYPRYEDILETAEQFKEKFG